MDCDLCGQAYCEICGNHVSCPPSECRRGVYTYCLCIVYDLVDEDCD